jgi:hypothetical protein
MPGISEAKLRPVVPPHFLADLYTFDWAKMDLRLPVVCSLAVAVCLYAGILAGHPGGGLVAGGGALTIGFGPNQRIADSRLLPMLAGVFATATAALTGTVAGHRGVWMVAAAAGSAFIYGLLTARNTGISWVGQQACVALVVSSAFPMDVRGGLERAGLIAAGGLVQTVFASAALRIMPELRRDLLAVPRTLARTAGIESEEPVREMLRRLRDLPHLLPALSRAEATGYAVRLALTVGVAAEVYRLLGIQSGYWVPMTAVLVQKPAFFETLTRALARILGTLTGAWLCTVLISHVAPRPGLLALFTTLFAMLSFATNPVNYGLFAGCLTAYIVFLLSLNKIPGPLIAERRAWCTVLGGVIALVIHLDGLRRIRASGEATSLTAANQIH